MATRVGHASASLVGAFELIVATHPDAVAAQAGERALTYAALDRRSRSLARRLRTLGVGREDVVGVMAERGLETVVAVLAVARAGGAFAPLDPDSPRRRTLDQLVQTRARAVLAPACLVERVPGTEVPLIAVDADQADAEDRADDQPLDADTRPGDLFAVVFTSGSSGRPKGVAVEHRNLINLRIHYLQALERRLQEIGMFNAIAMTFEGSKEATPVMRGIYLIENTFAQYKKGPKVGFYRLERQLVVVFIFAYILLAVAVAVLTYFVSLKLFAPLTIQPLLGG